MSRGPEHRTPVFGTGGDERYGAGDDQSGRKSRPSERMFTMLIWRLAPPRTGPQALAGLASGRGSAVAHPLWR
jgi:hypothetical protein